MHIISACTYDHVILQRYPYYSCSVKYNLRIMHNLLVLLAYNRPQNEETEEVKTSEVRSNNIHLVKTVQPKEGCCE